MKGLLRPLETTIEYQNLLQGLQKGFTQQMVFGLAGSQRSYLFAGLAEQRRTVLIVMPGEAEANALVDDLTSLLPDKPVLFFPVWQLLPYQIYAHSNDVLAQRLRVLNKLAAGQPAVVVTSVEALLRRLAPPAVLRQSSLQLVLGQRVDPESLHRQLVDLGYERVDLVESRGQFSSRGGITDIFPMIAAHPVRIEFFDDEVDSVRHFDVATQRSLDKLKAIDITPCRELVVTAEGWQRCLDNYEQEYKNQLKKLQRSGSVDAVHQLASQGAVLLEQIRRRVPFAGMEQLLSYFYPQPVTLLDYFVDTPLVLVDDPLRCKEVADTILKERNETYIDLLNKGKVLPGHLHSYLEWRQLLAPLERLPGIYCSFLPRHPQFLRPQNVVNFPAKAMHSFLGHTEVLADEVRHWRRRNYAVVLLVSSEERAANLLNLLRDAKIDAFWVKQLNNEVKEGNVVITVGQLAGGFELISARLVVITDAEIFGQRKKSRKHRARRDRPEPLADLKPGDYVVHVNHGIGRYLGIITLDIGGLQKDYLQVQYAGEDKLYVPTDQVGMLQKYLGAEADHPKLSRLGGSEWAKAKARVKEAVRDMARELLELYAARQTVQGYAFSPDTPWQAEFEAQFPYEETPDQLRAIQEVKRDMEKPRPMDRLLCGDVGYGKTEVALRAAFKAVMDNKQVAVLVPTTILAQQHYNTFRERFANYPVRIEMLSRFRTPKEQRQVLAGLATGEVDIVIGTHRLVQDDIYFKDLGLLVVDEEQRFGVMHKEKLKQLRQNVDVLTLTATPIPRTLHMSLVGVRDTSVLETPPEERFPVQTYVLEEDPVLIREAIRRELNRGGQVYFVHNRVVDLDRLAGWLQGLVPEARLGVAHGQMKEDELEQIMLEFMDGAYDVLVCTTIVETGLDIANVNTLIVKDADHFGLAQLYQLRGRVGRTNRLAYAYFLFRRDKVLTEVSERRLSAIREFTEFGSGYKIAMRDLEIRGAGNILGAQQHGHIAEVGFEMYCRLLEEAIQEARGHKTEQVVDTAVELPVEAYIPDTYVPDGNQKVELYRRLAAMQEVSELADLEDELVDRYGDLPDSVRCLLLVAQLKMAGRQLHIKSISRPQGYYRLLFAPDAPLDGEKLVAISEKYKNNVKFHNSPEGFEIKLISREKGDLSLRKLEQLYSFLGRLK
ncbi:transcription-repair coupling factor [Desulforamulus hydrothermalis]|uniref:Transcription-repair-coupling factor n=1 Tax=Desulforamulus hydrothermalis Lam5 = DSM 18033 TaxID=1121428 RepID=K8DZQ7_9FIRM|nr:transcription-repair coupling factor [Desulforamulus hydrothermalis]CCO08624.1 Transcription-repair-coupling factor [Desulforamulus hydrothermalis Lam5 = DSM 18033]SHH00923.1 transcription-repair coupling factor [Desulforamulus hydrothermalis Lam5 = DSM 18033]